MNLEDRIIEYLKRNDRVRRSQIESVSKKHGYRDNVIISAFKHAVERLNVGDRYDNVYKESEYKWYDMSNEELIFKREQLDWFDSL